MRTHRPWPLPASNICAFGKQVVWRFGNNFDAPVSKADGMALELGQQVHRPGKRLVKPLVAFGAVVKLRSREHNGSVDVYGTGRLRWRVWISAFGVYKYIHPGATGDVGGYVSPTLTRSNSPHKFMSVPDWYFMSPPRCWFVECKLDERRFRQFTLFPAAVRGVPAQLDADSRPVCNASTVRTRQRC